MPKRPDSVSWEEWQNGPVYEKWKEDFEKWGRFAELKELLEGGAILDLVAFIHLFHWPVVDPKRMSAVRMHLLQMIALSRENWHRIRAETDNKREWVPAPSQTGIFDGLAVTNGTILSWHTFLRDFENILEGRQLISHWRYDDGRGINVRRMFDEPQAFDPVMILQGSAVLPYMEKGNMLGLGFVFSLFNMFDGGFFTYAAWFN